VIAALLMPAAAAAKVTCEEPRRPAEDVPLRGLPDAPIEGREYRLTAVLRAEVGVNPAPHLAVEYCGDDVPRESAASPGGWFRERRGRGADVYVLDLRFDHPGPWTLAFMDRTGAFKELGFRHVRAADGEERPPGDHRVTGLAALSVEHLLWIFQR